MPFVAVLSGCNKDPVVPLAAADTAEAVTAAARARFGNLNEWLSEYALDSDGDGSSGEAGAGADGGSGAEVDGVSGADGVPTFGTEPYPAFHYVPPEAGVVATYEPTEATREQLKALGLTHADCGRFVTLVTVFEVAGPGPAVDLAWIARLNLG